MWHHDAREFGVGPETHRRRSSILQRLVIHPERARWLKFWDMYIVVLLLISWYWTPMQVTIMPCHTSTCRAWLLAMDASLSVNMFFQFFLAYAIQSDSGAKLTSAGLWEENPWTIARSYLLTWFLVDAAAIWPSSIWLMHNCDHESYRKFRWIMLLRALILLRMMRRPRIWQFFKNQHAQTGFPLLALQFVKFGAVMFFAMHWLACVWIETALLVADNREGLAFGEHVWIAPFEDKNGDVCGGGGNEPWCMYTLSLYWSVTTITSVGYGDLLPLSFQEISVATSLEIFCALIWAYIVGSFISLLDSLGRKEYTFSHLMDDITDMSKNRGCEDKLQVKLRYYLHEARGASRRPEEEQFLRDKLSVAMQREIAGAEIDLLEGIFWAKHLDREPLMDLMCMLQPMFYGPLETIMLQNMMIIVRTGVLACDGRVLVRGNSWGADLILLDSRHEYEAVQEGTRLICRDNQVNVYESASNISQVVATLHIGSCVIATARPRWCAGEPDAKNIRPRHLMVGIDHHSVGGDPVVDMKHFSPEVPVPRTLSYVSAFTLEKECIQQVCRQHPEADRHIRRAQIHTSIMMALMKGLKKQRLQASLLQKRRTGQRDGDDTSTQNEHSGMLLSALSTTITMQRLTTSTFHKTKEHVTEDALGTELGAFKVEFSQKLAYVQEHFTTHGQEMTRDIDALTERLDKLVSAAEEKARSSPRLFGGRSQESQVQL